MLTEFPSGIKFKYNWRTYQQRVLDDLKTHLNDDHLHIIAPPGSGKTVLGLEVMLRLNQPVLILAPTITIRNQWIQRFCELFLQSEHIPGWISRDVRNPQLMTVVTYQALHAACRNQPADQEDADEEEDADENRNEHNVLENLSPVVEKLREKKVKTIIVDEAHHLRNEWWQTLIKIKDQLSAVVVGLTATPPYDVTVPEWQRYISLNGPIDTEISVPELIKEGDLCPHQDYVYLAVPDREENEFILKFRERSEQLYQEIKSDETIINALLEHPILNHPEENIEWIYSNISFFSASLIYLNSNGHQVSDKHIELVGNGNAILPALNETWLEILLDFYLLRDKEFFNKQQKHKETLEGKLRRNGIIERRQISFSHNKAIAGLLASSISKLHAIKEITDFEYGQLGPELRMVILTDYIRKEFFVNTATNETVLNKIGVISIFEKLRRNNNRKMKIGVMTGSIVIIPTSAYSAFEHACSMYGINKINLTKVPFDHNYLQVPITDQLKNDIVHIITGIFQTGEIEVLIGTKSLLGEGWDAPAINSLILASFVGSFVTSNQMRGRAIRAEKSNPDKTANIWHLVCIDPTIHSGGDDFDFLKRRFRAFVGISVNEDPSIENGINRLEIPQNIHVKAAVDKQNTKSFLYAAERKKLLLRWNIAIDKGTALIEEIRIPFSTGKIYSKEKKLYFYKTIANVIATFTGAVMVYLSQFMDVFGKAIRNTRNPEDLLSFLYIFLSAGTVLFARSGYKTLRLYITYRDISKDVKKIAQALLDVLIKEGSIHTDRSALHIESTIDKYGAVYCHLEGGTTFEKSLFITSLQEILEPIENPRYIIIRQSRLLFFVKQKDFHAVPEIAGKNKILAEFFYTRWKHWVGRCKLIFTRNPEGRKILIRSRMKSLSAQFNEPIEQVNKWK